MKRIIAVIIIALAIILMVDKVSADHYEDGSGRIVITYCVPFAICEE